MQRSGKRRARADRPSAGCYRATASEIWSSREEFQAYGEKLTPILSDIGIEFSAEPEIFEVQNLIK